MSLIRIVVVERGDGVPEGFRPIGMTRGLRLATAGCAAAVAIGAAGLAGPHIGIPIAARWAASLPPIHPWVSAMLIAVGSGAAILCGGHSRTSLARGLGVMLIVAGSALLLAAGAGNDSPALASAACAVLAGAALVIDGARDRYPRLYGLVSTAGLVIVLLAAVTLAYDLGAIYKTIFFDGFAIPAVAGFGLAFVGLLAARPDSGWTALLRTEGPAGLVARRLLPLAALLPLFLGWIAARVGDVDGVDAIALAVCSLAVAMAMTAAVRWTVSLLADAEQERRRSEAALREHEERLLLSQQVAGAASWEWEPESGRTSWSAEYSALHGIDPSEPPSIEAFRTAIHPDDWPPLAKKIKQLLDAPAPQTGKAGTYNSDFRVVLPDGRTRWIASAARAIYEDSRPVRLIGLNQDMTERVEAMAELRRLNEEARKATEAKSRFLAAASHDIRQPVQSLFLFLSMLRGKSEDPAAAKVVELMQQALDSLKQLLDGLLDVSRLEAGVITPQIGRVEMSELLDRLFEEYRPRAEERGLRLRKVACRAAVSSDPALLERMLRNLIENALKFTRSGGGVVMGCRRHAGRIRLTVADNGIGIAPDKLPHIFDEFYQLDDSTAETVKGLGLGLSIFRRLARLLGQEIGVASQEGRGSRFWIELPTAEDRIARSA